MDFTIHVSQSFGLSPFEVLKQDKDDVIMLINYYVEKGDMNNEPETYANTRKHTQTHNNERIRVNDKTATGGWF